MPRSKARCSVAIDSASSVGPRVPDIPIHPTQIRETSRSVGPNFRYSIETHLPRPSGVQVATPPSADGQYDSGARSVARAGQVRKKPARPVLSENDMLTPEANVRLTQVGPGTP